MNFFYKQNPSFKYRRFTPSGCKYIGIRKFEFVAKPQFPWDVKRKISPIGVVEKKSFTCKMNLRIESALHPGRLEFWLSKPLDIPSYK